LKVSYIVLDVRSKNDIEKGHIPKAVAAPDGKVESLKDQFPKYKKAYIIICNQNGDVASATSLYKTISGWGYKEVSILQGGFDGWKKAGKKVATGPAAKEIKYVRKLLPGEVTYEKFKDLVNKPSKDHIIVDTRTVDEFHACGLPYAYNIPLEILETRLDDLPKDMNIVIHCSTGVRAEMAYNILKKAGYKVNYLKDTVNMARLDMATCKLK
jgi:rhodanese-related sulfurtransferase